MVYLSNEEKNTSTPNIKIKGEISATIPEDEDELSTPAKPPVQYRNDFVLKLLNSNTEDPYLIWDNATRAELLDFVERHRTSNENIVCSCNKHHSNSIFIN
jgi:DnaJ family protein C protein 13